MCTCTSVPREKEWAVSTYHPRSLISARRASISVPEISSLTLASALKPYRGWVRRSATRPGAGPLLSLVMFVNQCGLDENRVQQGFPKEGCSDRLAFQGQDAADGGNQIFACPCLLDAITI